jgi:hypothetical protein
MTDRRIEPALFEWRHTILSSNARAYDYRHLQTSDP